MTIAQGNCLCGAIVFTVKLPSLWVAHCHCSMCQKAGGSAFMTWAGFKESDCEIEDPKNLLQWFQSSNQAKRGSCKSCSSQLFFKSSRWPDEIHITLSNFQTPIDKAPEAHVFWDTHVDWVGIEDELPRKTAQQILKE